MSMTLLARNSSRSAMLPSMTPSRSSGNWDRSLSSLLDVRNDLSIPVAVEKTEGPSTCITFLGIAIDTVANHLMEENTLM